MSAAPAELEPVPEPGDTFGLPITCVDCGSSVQLVNGRADRGTRLLAIVQCTRTGCRHTWSIEALMRRAPS